MDISYKIKKLQKICNSKELLERNFGQDCGRKIAKRLLELKAAQNLGMIPSTPPPRCHMLTGDREGQFSVDIKQPYRLIFVQDHKRIPVNPDGGIDLLHITAICILEVTDPH